MPLKHKLFLLFLASTPLVELFAGTTPYVTYINLVYKLFVFAVGIFCVWGNASFKVSVARNLILPLMYVVVFTVTSWFGESFEYSVRYRVWFLPLLLVDFCSWYMAGYLLDDSTYAKYVYRIGALFAVSSLMLAGVGIIDADKTRVIYGVDVPIALAAAVMSSSVFFSGILVLAALSSLKKTVVLCAGVGLLVPLLLKLFVKAKNWPRPKNAILSIGGGGMLLALIALPLAQTFLPFMMATLERLSYEREDVLRLAMAAEYLRLLDEHFPNGIGYYMFGYMTADTLPYTTYTADGTELNDGMSLHNTFMHFTLEGGLPILAIVGLLYWKLGARLRKLFSFGPAKGIAILITAWAMIGIVYGLFNQFHATRYFFAIFGFAFGCYEKYRHQLVARYILVEKKPGELPGEDIKTL